MFLFPPTPATRNQFATYVAIPEVFTTEELEKIERLCSTLTLTESRTGQNGEVSDYRNCKDSNIPMDQSTASIHEKIASIVLRVNSDSFRFDVTGIFEFLKFVKYDSKNREKYDAHIDIGNVGVAPRKLSFVLQLSDPQDYEGGDLELVTSETPEAVPRKKGQLVIFPSYTLHRVTPVTKGVRQVIVGWVGGPSFT